MNQESGWTLETWDDFLTDNFYFLSKLTKVEPFLPWLRQERILTPCDEEDILSLNTSASRSARLLDTIKYKGIKGAQTYMDVVEWIYPEVFTSITGKTPRLPPEEFKCKHAEFNCFRKSKVLLDQLQKCMGSILEENNWKRENIVELRETIQKLKHENETMVSEMKLLQNKLQSSMDEADEFKSTNSELHCALETLKDDNRRKSTRLEDMLKNLNWRNNLPENLQITVSVPSSLRSPKCNGLDNRSKYLEESLVKFEEALRERQIENERQRREIDQLLDLNQRLKSDYEKAVRTTQNQRETLKFYKSENEQLSTKVCVNFGTPSESSDTIPHRMNKLIRKPVVKKKHSDSPAFLNGTNSSIGLVQCL